MQEWISKKMLHTVSTKMWRYREYKAALEKGARCQPAAGWARVIDEAVDSAPPEMARFVRAMWLYASGRQSAGYQRYLVVAREMNISISTLYRWREEFFVEVMARALLAGLLGGEDRPG